MTIPENQKISVFYGIILLLMVLSFIAGAIFHDKVLKPPVAVPVLMEKTKALDAFAADSSKEIRNNVISSESKKRQPKIKQYYENQKKTINSWNDSVFVVHQFVRMVTRIKNSNH